MVQVLILLEWTKLQSMKLTVALQSRSVLIKWSLLVLVVLISINKTKDIPCVSRVLAESCLGNCFFHFGLWGVV